MFRYLCVGVLASTVLFRKRIAPLCYRSECTGPWASQLKQSQNVALRLVAVLHTRRATGADEHAELMRRCNKGN